MDELKPGIKTENRRESEQKKIWERTHLAVAHQAGPASQLLSPAQLTVSTFFFL
jgi:hypothetical protein